MEIENAIIIAGGEGTRLRPLTSEIPKALIDINGRTLTEHVLDILKKYEISNVVLGIGYLSDKVKSYFGDGQKFGFNISYTVEEKPMGTAGPLILLPKFRSTFLMVNGDNLFSIDLKSLYDLHKKYGAVATIGLTYADDPSKFGVVKMDGARITEFIEKPAKGRAPSHLINSGYYILEPEVFDMVHGKSFVMMEKDVFRELAAKDKLFGLYDPGQWFDTGTFESLKLVRDNWRGV